jgi:hypothetical protein
MTINGGVLASIGGVLATSDGDPLGALAGITCTVDELAALIEIDARTVYRHARDDGLPRVRRGVYPLADCVQWYLRRSLDGRGPTGDPVLDAERLRLVTAQADQIELKNAQTRGELLEVELVRGAMSQMLAICAAQIDVLGPRAAGRLAGKQAAEIMLVLRDECTDIRSAIAAEVDAFADRVSRGGDSAATPETNGGAMG